MEMVAVVKIWKGVNSATDDNGNAMLQSLLCKLFKKEIGRRYYNVSYRRYGENGESCFCFLMLFVHAAARGGTCAFTLKIVNTMIKNSSRDDRPLILT